MPDNCGKKEALRGITDQSHADDMGYVVRVLMFILSKIVFPLSLLTFPHVWLCLEISFFRFIIGFSSPVKPLEQ